MKTQDLSLAKTVLGLCSIVDVQVAVATAPFLPGTQLLTTLSSVWHIVFLREPIQCLQ